MLLHCYRIWLESKLGGSMHFCLLSLLNLHLLEYEGIAVALHYPLSRPRSEAVLVVLWQGNGKKKASKCEGKVSKCAVSPSGTRHAYFSGSGVHDTADQCSSYCAQASNKIRYKQFKHCNVRIPYNAVHHGAVLYVHFCVVKCSEVQLSTAQAVEWVTFSTVQARSGSSAGSEAS